MAAAAAGVGRLEEEALRRKERLKALREKTGRKPHRPGFLSPAHQAWVGQRLTLCSGCAAGVDLAKVQTMSGWTAGKEGSLFFPILAYCPLSYQIRKHFPLVSQRDGLDSSLLAGLCKEMKRENSEIHHLCADFGCVTWWCETRDKMFRVAEPGFFQFSSGGITAFTFPELF
ncbi:coiled-coil domain-containing protein 12 isoform X1 [Onychomys torridus]|uniref:coiled-coil domain-containing protein 12 isoform X1 n=1 Tax=Onychomys torridus TaxID=38674 RepID=UPI00167F6C23|nr:coiled-coil domain-containing protein 12 isoform X1 [Onychomys torridus]XP_036047685.1 coiled-coil domain-containing protein 12 isoform X1 [Onychomys torridus]